LYALKVTAESFCTIFIMVKKPLTNKLFTFLLLVISTSVCAQENISTASAASKSIEMVKLNQEPEIDGILDDEVWQQARVITDFYQTTPIEFAMPSQDTEVRIFYTEDAIYVGAKMFEDDPELITAQSLQQYGGVTQEDVFILLLDPFLNRRSGYRFAISPNGIWWDAIYSSPTETDANWLGIWQGESAIGEDGWTTEIRIPFQTLSFDPDNSDWGINFQRIIRRSDERISWLSRDRQQNPGTSGVATGISGIQQGKGLDIVPGLTLRRDKVFGAQPGAGVENSFEPTLDLFYKITPSLNAAVTLNTDFSAAEVDNRQVNLTRFSLFFPERRDFFLRDSDIFEFGQIGTYDFTANWGTGFSAIPGAAQQNARPFFSRRIGLSANGAPVDLNVGGKISGRVGNFNVGSLIISQDEDVASGVDATDIFVGRAVMNVLSESQLGVMMTDGDPQSNLDNTLYGADFRYRNSRLPNNKTVEVNAWVQQTDTEGKQGDDMAYSLALSSPNRNGLRGTAIYTRVEQNFDPAVGYVNRSGVEEYAMEGGYSYLMPPSSYFASYNVTVDGYRAELLSSGELSSQDVGIRLSLYNRTRDRFFARLVQAKEVLLNDFSIFRASDGSRSVVIPSGSYTFNEARIFLNTGTHRKLSANLSVWTGEFYDGEHLEFRSAFTWRPSNQLEFGLTHNENSIKLPAGDFKVRQINLQANFALNTRWSWNNLLQYDNVSEAAGFNSRLLYIPEAGQQAILVFNYGAEDRNKDNNFISTASDLSLRATYTFRY